MSEMKIMPLSLIILLIGFDVLAADCSITEAETNSYMQMDYKSFDQSVFLKAGWRKFGDRGCYSIAATLLDKYYQIHSEMNEQQKTAIEFHSGQMYAFENANELAVQRFQNSFYQHEPENTPILWNAYVTATIAFLQKDKQILLKQRQAIANGPSFQGRKANLEVVDRLIKYFGQSYSVAYNGQ